MPEGVSNMLEAESILGHSEREIRRLMRQAALLRPITGRLPRGAGITQGMRVLDLGCGAGDVSMLAAELVGASGSVVGIDRSQGPAPACRNRPCYANLSSMAARIRLTIALVADTRESAVPPLVPTQVLTADTIAIETFENRLRNAVVEARSQIVGTTRFCDWTRV